MNELHDRYYPELYREFLNISHRHVMKVLRDDGLYRHLRFATPRTSQWHWEIITWPGSLVIRGDLAYGLTFTAQQDMFRFFDDGQPEGHINVPYWTEKLARGTTEVVEFSFPCFAAWVREEVPGLAAEILNEADGSRTTSEATEVLDEYGIDWDFDTSDNWMDYNDHYVRILHALLWSVKKYHKSKGTDR